ncbi:2-hydroxyacyl-CoA lyase [Dendrobium catenatum]|uniref:2-hydroxyacyl-CoA lyase n=1 Tax=Dendrobium catenatum TaxID=906689 RepID=A0A2I0X0A8_9ASPA|nr:2-hydroxyacyl-CoA lyase [Dendrobium catenatum]
MLPEEGLALEDGNFEANEKVFKAIMGPEHPVRVRTQDFGDIPSRYFPHSTTDPGSSSRGNTIFDRVVRLEEVVQTLQSEMKQFMNNYQGQHLPPRSSNMHARSNVAKIELRKPYLGLVGDAATVLDLINREIKDDPFFLGKSNPWVAAISKKAKDNVVKMEIQLAKDVVPFNFLTPMRIIRDAILAQGSPAPILVSEGANTMDVGRAVLGHTELRTRLDAGTWGTMGVGLGYCIAAAVASPDRLVVAVEGDSSFGFSAMEVEVL